MTNPVSMLPSGSGKQAESSGGIEQQAAYGLASPEREAVEPETKGFPSSRAKRDGPLEVTHVGPCFCRGGAEQQLIDLTRFFDPSRVRIRQCIVTNPQLVDPAVVADVPVAVEVGGVEAVRRAAQQSDVILSWGVALDDWLINHRPKLCVFLAHGDGAWTGNVLNGSARVVDHVIAVSQRVKDRTCNGYATSVILNGVDSARLGQSCSRQEMRASLGFGPEDFVLGYVGRFSSEKRPDLVIKAAALLPREFKVLLVGWGPQQNELIVMANAMIPGRFSVVKANGYLGDYYQSLDALCLLSPHEGFALVVLEAMMCDRPVIVTPVGSVPEFVTDRVNGIIVSGEVNSVSQAARLLHEHPHWARGVAAEGKSYAQQHGHARRMAREYEELLERLWREKNGRPAPR